MMVTAPGTLDGILDEKLIAVLRLDSAEMTLEIADAVARGGISVVEITMTTPDALGAISRLSERKELIVGAGTVLTTDQARAAIDAGARFCASPVFEAGVMEIVRNAGVVTMPGALTPTEIYCAWQGGADLVKVFPMPAGGRAYIASILGPLPDVRLAPSGGVNDTTASELLRAGAAVLNVGSWLTHGHGSVRSLIEIEEQTVRLVRSIAPTRD